MDFISQLKQVELDTCEFITEYFATGTITNMTHDEKR